MVISQVLVACCSRQLLKQCRFVIHSSIVTVLLISDLWRIPCFSWLSNFSLYNILRAFFLFIFFSVTTSTFSKWRVKWHKALFFFLFLTMITNCSLISVLLQLTGITELWCTWQICIYFPMLSVHYCAWTEDFCAIHYIDVTIY